MKSIPHFLSASLFIFLLGCDQQIEKGVMKSDLSKDVEMVTDYGSIVLRLSDETPLHRNNFIKLVNQKFYDSITFHRIIDNFVIQAGNPTTKPSQVYNADGIPELSYTIEAELKPTLFHKRGALGAARTGYISNRKRASSAFQFYIVQRGPNVDSMLQIAHERINKQLAINAVLNSEHISQDLDAYTNAMGKFETNNSKKDSLLLNTLKAKIDAYNIDSLALLKMETLKEYKIPNEHAAFYKTVGGTPHLDQNYTIFGEVVSGMEVVDRIAKVKTEADGKPIVDVRIHAVKMIERKSYSED